MISLEMQKTVAVGKKDENHFVNFTGATFA